MPAIRVRNVRLALVLGVLGCGACGSAEAVPSVTGTAEASSGQTAASSADEQPATWDAFDEWSPGHSLVVDGAEYAKLSTHHECFDGECGSPMDYSQTDDFVVPAGAEITIHAASDLSLDTTVLWLSPELTYLPVSRVSSEPGLVSLDLDPGVYHVDVRADVEFNGIVGRNRLRHFIALHVIEAGVACTAASDGPVTGVSDESGCPSDRAQLDLDTLHPQFHCAPWPATLVLNAQPGRRYLRTQHGDTRVDVVSPPPEDLEALGLVIPSGELFTSGVDDAAVYVQRDESTVERWAIEETEVGCA